MNGDREAIVRLRELLLKAGVLRFGKLTEHVEDGKVTRIEANISIKPEDVPADKAK